MVVVECGRCHAKFKARQSSRRKYCSLQCAYASPSRTARDNAWTKWDYEVIEKYYRNTPRQEFSIGDLVAALGRTEAAIYGRAHRLGLTVSRAEAARVRSTRSRANMSAAQKRRYAALGVKPKPPGRGEMTAERLAARGRAISAGLRARSPEAIAASRAKAKATRDAQTSQQKLDAIQRRISTRMARYGSVAPKNVRGSWRAGWREIGGRRHFFRSRWEANYARYLSLLKRLGLISEWHHEPEMFRFPGATRKPFSYLPDFKVWHPCGLVEYHEVKGWVDADSKRKIDLMAKHHPQINLVMVMADWFRANKSMQRFIADWEA